MRVSPKLVASVYTQLQALFCRILRAQGYVLGEICFAAEKLLLAESNGALGHVTIPFLSKLSELGKAWLQAHQRHRRCARELPAYHRTCDARTADKLALLLRRQAAATQEAGNGAVKPREAARAWAQAGTP